MQITDGTPQAVEDSAVFNAVNKDPKASTRSCEKTLMHSFDSRQLLESSGPDSLLLQRSQCRLATSRGGDAYAGKVERSFKKVLLRWFWDSEVMLYYEPLMRGTHRHRCPLRFSASETRGGFSEKAAETTFSALSSLQPQNPQRL